jgi:hypothetical protein
VPTAQKLARDIQAALELGVSKAMDVAHEVTEAMRTDPEVEALVRDEVARAIDSTDVASDDVVVITRAYVDQDDPMITGLMLGEVRVSDAFEDKSPERVTVVFEAAFEADFELMVNDFEIEEIRISDPTLDVELTEETWGIARATGLEGTAFIYAAYDRQRRVFSDWERASMAAPPYELS